MRQKAATAIRRIRVLVRAGDCRGAQQQFNALIPLVGTRSGVPLKSKTVVRLWSLVGSCRRKR